MTYLAAVAPPVPVPSRDPAPATLAVAEALQPDLAQGFQIDAPRLRIEMERAFGGSDADGAWNWKLAYEAGEVALVLFLRKFGRALLTRAGSPAALLPIVAKVACLLPTHTRRSEEMERFQQFSTPLPMGLAAMAAAQITPRDLVLEPSAGTGLLAILAEIAGGSLALNELAETRADLLRHLFPGRPVTTFDAAQIDDHLDAGFRPSVILMNPPFSAVANVDGRSTEATARHLRSALARLVPGGRLVAITGAGFAPDAPAWAETFARLTETAHLVFTGAVSGAAFAKHGTSFETRISVFDKCRGGEPGGITLELARPISPDVATLLSQIAASVPPRLALDPDVVAAIRPTSPFPGNPARATRAAISTTRATPAAQPHHSSAQIEAEDLAYTLRDATAEANTARLSDAIYETFRLQAIESLGPGQSVRRETGSGDDHQTPAGGQPRKRRAQMPGRRLGRPAIDIGHRRERRVHQDHARAQPCVQMIVDLGCVKARDRPARKEAAQKFGARVGQLVQREAAARNLGEDRQ